MGEKLNSYRLLKYDLDRSVGYHNMRGGFFQRNHNKAIAAVVIALATPLAGFADTLASFFNATFSWLLSDDITGSQLTSLLSFVGMIAALADLYFRPAQVAGLHAAAELNYKQIRNELETFGESEEDKIFELRKRYEAVDSRFEERHVLVNLVSHNRVARVSGLKQVNVNFFERFFMHWFPFASRDVKNQ